MKTSKWQKSLEPLFAAVDVPHFMAQTLSAINPVLKGKPFAVIDQKAESHKTPILAISRAAREMGLMPGTPVFIAQRRWKQLQFLPRDLKGETQVRKAMEAIYLNHTPTFSLRGRGGAVLDMTGTPDTRVMKPIQWGLSLQRKLLAIGLEAVSIGIASSQSVARVLARRIQPDGIQVCPIGEETALLDPLPPNLLPDISPYCRDLLKKYGLASIGSVRRLEREELILRFGNEGEKLFTLARGMDLEAVTSKGRILSAETVLSEDLNDHEALRNKVRFTADKLGYELRNAGFKAGKVTLVLTYSDKRNVRKTAQLDPPTGAFLELAEKSDALFQDLYQRRVALRRIQLQVAVPLTETGQTNLFDTDANRKQDSLAMALDKIRTKRSFNAVVNGGLVKPTPELRPKRGTKPVKSNAMVRKPSSGFS